jgi:hypothetical protein
MIHFHFGFLLSVLNKNKTTQFFCFVKQKIFFIFPYVLQRMFDWNWLWVAGELGVSLGFYLWCRSDEKYLAILQVEIY